MNRRRALNRANRRIDQQRGINAAAWFAGQSFHANADMPFERLSVAQLDRAGAALLPEPDETPRCIYCGVACFACAPLPYCSTSCAINAENS